MMAEAIKFKCGNASQKLVLLMLADYSNSETGQCNPSHKRLADQCSMSVASLKVQISKLEELRVLKVIHSSQDGIKRTNQYVLNLKTDSQNPAIDSQNLARGRSESGWGDSQNLARGRSESGYKPIKEPISIEPIREPAKTLVEALPLPDFVNAQIWEMYKKHRGSKFSANSQSLILKTLAKAKLNGHDPNAMLEQSIANGWQGVFEPKSQGANYGNERSQRRRQTIEGLTGYKAGSPNATSNAIEGFAERVD